MPFPSKGEELPTKQYCSKNGAIETQSWFGLRKEKRLKNIGKSPLKSFPCLNKRREKQGCELGKV